MQTAERGQRERYLRAVEGLASIVFADVLRPEAREDAVDVALTALRRVERSGGSEHAWIFSDPRVLELSENVAEALEVRPEERREWLHAHLGSAVSAVARFDVMAEVVERMAHAAGELAEAEQAETVKA